VKAEIKQLSSKKIEKFAMKIEGIQAISVPDGWIPPPPCFLGLMETLSKI
jgi:hypothetical protein